MAYTLEKQPNGKYKIRVWSKVDQFGKKKTKQVSNLENEKIARRKAQEIECDFNEDIKNLYNPNIKLKKLEEMYFEERKDKISPTTLYGSFDYARKVILEYFGEMKVYNISTYIVQKFVDLKQSTTKLRKKTIKNYISYLNAIINWGVNNDIIDNNRIKKIKYKDDEEEFEATTLSLEEIVKILPVMKKEYYNIYIPTIISILTGARRGEALGLRWQDIDFDNNSISFIKNKIVADGNVEVKNKLKTTKSKRLNPMANFLKEELIEHKKLCNPKSEFVCSNIFIGDIHPDYLTHSLHDFMLKKFNIDMREHDLRHTFSQLIEDNEDIIIAKSQMLGHSNLDTTMNVYTRPSFVRKLRLANALGDLIKDAMCAKKVCQ